MAKPTQSEILEFLDESNAIEWIYGAEALQDHYRAYKYLMKQPYIWPTQVFKAHYLIMKNQPLEDKYKWVYRDCPVYIGWNAALHYSLIVDYMSNFFTLVNNEPDWKNTHILFEKIHPFCDGNWRVGRLLLNWQRLKCGIPLLIIHRWEEQKKYYSWFTS